MLSGNDLLDEEEFGGVALPIQTSMTDGDLAAGDLHECPSSRVLMISLNYFGDASDQSD